MRIDFISDINCPWCALGVTELKNALDILGDQIDIELHFQPFELNPQLPPEGKNLVAYLQEKYGMDEAQIESSHANLRARGAEAGFHFAKRENLWNSFKAHQLLFWVEQDLGLTAQKQLKLALVQAYQGEAKNTDDNAVLLSIVEKLGFSVDRAKQVLESGEFAKQVRDLEHQWQSAGINAVPSIVINRKHLVQGAQPADSLVEIFKQLALEAA